MIHDPECFEKFEKNEIVIPFVVLEELDSLKKNTDFTGYAARKIIRYLENLSTLNHGSSLQDGIVLSTGGIVRIDNHTSAKENSIDNAIIETALTLKDRMDKVILVSRDLNVRLKARAKGLLAEDYEATNVDIRKLYTGISEIETSTEFLKLLYNKAITKEEFEKETGITPIENQFFVIKSIDNPSLSALAVYHREILNLVKISNDYLNKKYVAPQNKEQRFALWALLNDNIKVVSLIGPAGTGKTLMGVSAGLYQTVELGKFRALFITKPVIPLKDQDIGWLKGSKMEKLHPWMQSYFDNMELVGKDIDYWIEFGMIEIEALAYIRGRSLNHRFIIVDEVQNLTPHIVKTIVSRVGKRSKIVLMGDIEQIDAPYLNATNNGLVNFVDKFKGESLYAHITLNKTLRSKVAELAAKLL